ncbi:MAG: ribosome maturation factor RimP [Pseudomonadota bacterium]
MDIKDIETKAEELVKPVLDNLGYGLVACDFINESGQWILRLYIDKDGGVSIDDCARASHGVEDLLAVEDIVPVRYNLEVSSPGIFRPLKKREDFERYMGERARIKTLHPIDGRSNFKGQLAGLEGNEIIMIIDDERYRIPLSEVNKAKLEPQEITAAKH